MPTWSPFRRPAFATTRPTSLTRCVRRQPAGRRCCRSARGCSFSGLRGCWMDGHARRTGTMSKSWRSDIRKPRSTRTCSSSTMVTSSPARARLPVSTPAFTWCAGSWAARWPRSSPAGWWCLLSGTGGQKQYVDLPVPECSADSLQPVLTWMLENITVEHPVSSLARRVAMSDRTFARRFVAETGTTPHKWLSLQRVLHARTLLEQTDLGIESVATRSGFGTAALLRHHFRRVVGVAPQEYRRTFSST